MAALALWLTACRGGQQQPAPTALPVEATPAPSPANEAPPPAPAASAAETSVPNASDASGPPKTAERVFNFDSDRADAPPAGFSFDRTGSGAMGRWQVRGSADAPSKPNVLAQLDADATDFRFPIAVIEGLSLRDLRLSARCKPVSGRVDQACGLVFRYRDENNYYITRANPLENNVRLYFVKDGKRKQLASYSGRIAAGAWHEYAVEVRGDHIQVHWDGSKVLDHRDATFSDAGKVGLWTKADSVTHFDDLTVTPLEGNAP
jgi:hypothetical protein